MKERRAPKAEITRRELGTTSTGVQYDLRPYPNERNSPRNKKFAKYSAALGRILRRHARKAIMAAGVLFLFAGLSIGFGDTLWDRILPPLEAPPAYAPAQATSTAGPAAEREPVSQPTAAPAAQNNMPAASIASVWIPQSGSRYHAVSTCSGMKEAREVSIDQAKGEGFTACKRCNPPDE